MNKDRYILLHGEKIYVSEEVYRAFYQPIWREAKQQKVRHEMEYSLDALRDSGIDAISETDPIEQILLDKLLLDKLYAVLAELEIDERNLLHALYIQGKSGEEVAKSLGISRAAVHKRKHKALSKLKNLLKG